MILNSATRALADIFSPAIRYVLWKVLGLTILALVALWLAAREAFLHWVMPWVEPYLPGLPDWAGWLGFVAAFIWGAGLALAVAMLIAPVSAVVARIRFIAVPPDCAVPCGQAARQAHSRRRRFRARNGW